MVAGIYESLLIELGTALHLTSVLKPDVNNTCLLKLKDGLEIFVEIDKREEYLILGCDLGEVPLGRYKENLFREALKANGLPYPWNGIFAATQAGTHLSLYEMIPVKNLTGSIVADQFAPFSEKAKIWKEAIANGQLPSVSSGGGSRQGLFGLMS